MQRRKNNPQLILTEIKDLSIRIFGPDFTEYSFIRQIWAWLGHEKGVDP